MQAEAPEKSGGLGSNAQPSAQWARRDTGCYGEPYYEDRALRKATSSTRPARKVSQVPDAQLVWRPHSHNIKWHLAASITQDDGSSFTQCATACLTQRLRWSHPQPRPTTHMGKNEKTCLTQRLRYMFGGVRTYILDFWTCIPNVKFYEYYIYISWNTNKQTNKHICIYCVKKLCFWWHQIRASKIKQVMFLRKKRRLRQCGHQIRASKLKQLCFLGEKKAPAAMWTPNQGF